MVQINLTNFWCNNCTNLPASSSDIREVESLINAKLPTLYTALMKKHNGGNIIKDCFYYFDQHRETIEIGSIGIMHSLLEGEESILHDFLDPPEFFPGGLVAFADDGGGNLTCFDYRATDVNPPIVFWVCGDDCGKDTHFVSNNFKEFITMLCNLDDPDPNNISNDAKITIKQSWEKYRQKEKQLQEKYQEESAKRIAQLRPRTTPLTQEEERFIKMQNELAKDLEHSDK